MHAHREERIQNEITAFGALTGALIILIFNTNKVWKCSTETEKGSIGDKSISGSGHS